MRSAAARVLGLLLALAVGPAAGEHGVDWSFKAFGTLAAVGTDTDTLGFRRDPTQDTAATRDWAADIDSRLGLQLDVDLDHAWHAAVQWVARNHAGAFFEQNLEWAYLRWRPWNDLDLRVGRLGLDTFLLSDYRNVGYAYPWMRPPQEFYAPLFPYHFDGADIAQRFHFGEGFLTLKGFAGHNYTQVLPSYSPVFGLNSLLFGGSLAYESGDWRARIGYAQLRPLNDYDRWPELAQLRSPSANRLWPGASRIADDLSLQRGRVHYGSIGLAYDDGLWPIQAEAAYIDSSVPQLPTLGSAYLSVGRRLGNFTLYSLFGIAESLHHHVKVPGPLLPFPDLLEKQRVIEGYLSGQGVDQKSVSLGVRWDVYDDVALKAQWSHFWIGNDGGLFWLAPSVPPAGAMEVNVWSCGVDFVF
jgi:hypothetical protein